MFPVGLYVLSPAVVSALHPVAVQFVPVVVIVAGAAGIVTKYVPVPLLPLLWYCVAVPVVALFLPE